MTDSAIRYDFFSPRSIFFGWGRRTEVGKLASSLGKRAFVLHGSRTLESQGLVAEIFDLLQGAAVEPVLAGSISREPEVEDVDQVVAFLRQQGAGAGDLVLALGGGSAIDLAKTAAALVTNHQSSSVVDYLEGVGMGSRIVDPPLPFLAMPTTSGTGSEATKNAVISSYDPPFKKSLRSELMLARIVLVDPELTVSVAPTTTAYTGMDAITQLIESYVSRRAQPVPQALALQGLELAAAAIVEAVQNGKSRWAREAMAQAALLSGMALANSGLGLAHGVAAALGVHSKVPHGLACAVMLPVAMRVNRRVRESELARVGSVLSGESGLAGANAADRAIERVEELASAVGIPKRLSEIGVEADQIPAIVSSSRGNSMSGNPRELSDDELRSLLVDML